MSGSSAAPAAPTGVRSPANPITSAQVEVVLSRAASIFGLLVGLQTLPALLTQFSAFDSAIGLTVVVLVFGSLLLAGLAATFRQWRGRTFALFAGVYVVVLLFWDPIVRGPLPGGDAAWIYYLCNVATGFAVVASKRHWWPAAAYTVAAPILVGIVRATPDGGGASTSQALLDGLYCFFLGAVVLFISVALRQAAATVDAAQAHALETYAEAVRQNATEAERVRIDALVHDSVLTTLLSAARATTADAKALAARMARNAMRHLASAQSGTPETAPDVPLAVLAGRLRLAAGELPVPFELLTRDLGGGAVPESVADAVISAATQAMVNSANHAGGGEVTRRLRLAAAEGAVLVVVEDDGRGFDPSAIPVERLGVRTSILERMVQVGGTAQILSAPGEGTRVELGWEAPDVPANAADEEDEA